MWLIGGFEFVAEADYELALHLEHRAAAGYPELCYHRAQPCGLEND
jgi:hypothetical protein